MSTRIVCVICEAVTAHWVSWGAAHRKEGYYFCYNDCLAWWIERLRDEVHEKVANDCQEILRSMNGEE